MLLDWTLLHAANVFGFVAAEKIVVSLCVLIFFWGIFAFVEAASGQPPWFLAPCIAVLSYGYSFNMGFLNYYLSLGLASFSLALLWRGRGFERLFGLCIAPFILLAHPLGLSLALRGGALSDSLDEAAELVEIVVPAASVGAVFVVHWYLAHQTRFPVDWVHRSFLSHEWSRPADALWPALCHAWMGRASLSASSASSST